MNTSENFNPKEEFEIVKELPREEKSGALAEFIEKRALQQEQVADLSVQSVKLFVDQPDLSQEEMVLQLAEWADQKGITGDPVELIRKMVGKFKAEHNKIAELRGKYPDDLELAKYLLGFEPEGPFEIQQDTLSFVITLRFARDYRKVSHGSAGCVLTDNEKGVSTVVYNVFEYMGKVRSHEETHVINWVASKVMGIDLGLKNDYFARDFWPVTPFNAQNKLKEIDNPKQKRRYLQQIFWEIVMLNDRRIADEFLSFVREGRDPVEPLTKTEAEGGLYDYAGEAFDFYLGYLKDNLTEEDSFLVEEVSTDILRVQYPEFIRNIANHVEKLSDIGFSAEKIIALLLREHIVRWPREIDRMIQSKNHSIENDGK